MTRGNNFLVFTLDDSCFALALRSVERVIRAVEVTPLPQSPEGVSGVINMKGTLICVFDMRRYLQFPVREIMAGDRFIIAYTATRNVALIVDAVSGVMDVPELEIVGIESILPGLGHLEGAIRSSGRIILISDLDSLLGDDAKRIPDDVTDAVRNEGDS